MVSQSADSAHRGSSEEPVVVIVGGGFAGLNAALKLRRKPVRVILIDRKNHHTFQPLLYQAASGVLSVGQISAPLRRVLRAPNVEVLLGDVREVRVSDRTVVLDGGAEVSGDYLILAAGSRHSYFGHAEWEEAAPGLKTLEDALEIRRRVLSAFETAERTAFETGGAPSLTFVVVGGGPTGVELSGALADIAQRAAVKDFQLINTASTKVRLVEGSSRLLGMFPPEVSASSKRQLEELGVEVSLSARVVKVTTEGVQVGDEWIPAQAVLWAAGAEVSPLSKLLNSPLDKIGGVFTQADLSLAENPNVFVIGDMASMEGVPRLGSAAVQMGKFAASAILNEVQGKPRGTFRYRDKGTMAAIGRRRAVAVIGKLRLSGFLAWIIWGMVHIALLIGFGNRLRVMMEWIGAYFSNEREARLITDPSDPKDA